MAKRPGPSARPYPTLRAQLRGSETRRSTRAPWFAGFPARTRSVWAQCRKRK